MGSVNKLLGGIFAFVGGFFGFLKGLLGFNKSEYFMEMEEAKEEDKAALPAAASPAPAATAAIKPAPAKAEVATPTKATASNNGAKPAVQPAMSESDKPAVKTARADQPADAPLEPKGPQTPQPTPVIKAEPTETNFATKYLIPTASQNGRRRPGPSLDYFRDMAKQVKP